MKIPSFENSKDLFKFLRENEEMLILEKKEQIKEAYEIGYFTGKELKVSKSLTTEKADTETVLYRTVVINTTNYLDSHRDVHIPGLWNKSLQENKRIVFLQEHKRQFDKVIAKGDDLKAYVKNFQWNELGYNVQGQTEALTFEATIKADRNKEMFDLYKKNEIDQHSVGMRYVKLVMCFNDPDEGAEWEAWQKYAPQIINQDALEGLKYFWAVTEAKVIEGSAVLMGSNPITPAVPIKEKQDNTIALIDRIKIYEPNFSLENLNDVIEPQPNEEEKNIHLLTF
jgi:hypothetical protein